MTMAMAPRCMASRLPRLLSLTLITVLLCGLCQVTPALLVYDRQALLHIRTVCSSLSNHEFYDKNCNPPPHLALVPTYLWRTPVKLRRKRPRRRGKRGGVLVRIRSQWKSENWIKPYARENGYSAPHRVPGLRWIQLLNPGELSAAPRHLPLEAPLRRRRRHSRGVVQGCLRELKRCSVLGHEEQTLKFGLLNTRSLTNKTFILNDFFISRQLDIFLMCETWLQVGECAPFSELTPPDCSFLNTPRSTGRGGGLASVFKSSLNCRQVQTNSFSSFELQTFVLNADVPVLCALVYRPPKFNKSFIDDFTDFVAELTITYDHFLIAGDMNVHVCCKSNQLAKDFLEMTDSFNLTQWVVGASHEKGHTLDIVLSFGLTVNIEEICNSGISDHFAILFSVTLPGAVDKPCAPARRVRTINSQTVSRFLCAFDDSLFHMCDIENVDVDQWLGVFNSKCSNLLDEVAPLGSKKSKPVLEPWLNDVTRAHRRACRRAERKWKKDRLQVSYEILRNSLLDYQKAVKAAKTQFLSNLVSSNSHKPQLLFKMLNSLLNPCDCADVEASTELCDKFLLFFHEKVCAVRSSLTPYVSEPQILCPSAAVFDHFETVSLSYLTKVVQQMKPSNCPLDIIPSRLFKEVFPTIGPLILDFINSSLLSGCFPAAFKHAVVQPLLKKTNLDPTVIAEKNKP